MNTDPENGRWEVISVSHNTSYSPSETDHGTRRLVDYFILLKRRRAFYIMNVILPVLILSAISTLVFVLPAEAGEKVGMGITLVLAFAVYLTVLSDQMPNTSLHVSLLSVYLMFVLGLSILTVLLSVFVLSLHHQPDNSPVSHTYALGTIFLRKVLGMAPKRHRKDIASSSHTLQSKEAEKKERVSKQGNKVAPILVTEAYGKKSSQSKATSKDEKTREERESRDVSDDDDVMTWQDVAQTMDRFFFLLFTPLVLLATIACMLALFIGSHQMFKRNVQKLAGNITVDP